MTRYKLCQVMAKMEGFGQPGAKPTTHNNPLDLEHSPHSTHVAGDPIGWIPTIDLGWQDADRQVELWADRGLTIEQAIEQQTGWTAENGDVDGNDTDAYIAFVCDQMGLEETTPMAQVLQIPSDPA